MDFKMQTKCRTCLNSTNLELSEDITEEIKEKFTFCIPKITIRFKRGDIICNICKYQLENCVQFITRCIEVENNLFKSEECNKSVEKKEIIIPLVKCDENISKDDTNSEENAVNDCDTLKNISKYSDSEYKPDISDSDSDNDDLTDNDIKDTKLNLKCSLCDKIYHSKERFRKHHFTHTTEENLRVCPVCKLIYNSEKSYEDHINEKHPNKCLYKCDKCSKRFLKLCTYKRHLELFKDTESCRYTCGKCKKFFLRKNAYENHLEEIKDAPVCDFQQCSVCLVKFTREDFKEHLKIHADCISSVICELCGKHFASKQLLKCHKINTHGDPNSFICPHCGKGCKTKRYYTVHMKIHENRTFEETHKYICDKCPRRFSIKFKLTKHQKQHDNIKDFPCQYCDKSFCTQFHVNRHTRLVHLKVQPHECNLCGKTFGRRDYLSAHLKFHTGEPKFNRKNQIIVPRKTIDEESGKFVSLKKTERKKYDKSKSYVCKFCNKQYSEISRLRTHYRSHMNIRQYKCKYCDLAFVSVCAKSKHEKLHNDPTYIFRCPICFKRKNTEAELQQHVVIHTKKPYKCDYCPEAYGRQYLKDNHMAKFHSELQINKEKLKAAINDTTVLVDVNSQH